MLKVLQVGKYYPPHRGGMETHLADLCQELKSSVDLEVLVAHDENRTITETVDGVEVVRLATPVSLLANPINPELVGRIRRSQADIVHLHWPNPIALLAYLASGSKARLVVTYHSDIVRQKFSGALFQPILHRALRQARIIATSPNYVESSPVLRKFRSRCSVVPLGIDVERRSAVDFDRVRQFKQKYGDRMILATGRHIYYKGFQYLIEAMRNVDAHLVIAGDGPMRRELGSLVSLLNLEQKVSFAGQVSDEDLQALYSACSLFAFPSVARSEAFGLVQLEAMIAGKPVINTSIDSGVPYVSLHEQTGLTVEPASPEALSQGIQVLLRNEQLRAQYGDAARRRVFEVFTTRLMGAQTLDLYREVMNLPHGDRFAATSAA